MHKNTAMALEALLSQREKINDVSNDPLQHVLAYQEAKDQEIIAVFASALAFGRVSLFLPVIQEIRDIADKHGGPHNWILQFSQKDIGELASVSYRWNKPPDFALLAFVLQHVLQQYTSLEALFLSKYKKEDADIRPTLSKVIATLRSFALHHAKNVGLSAHNFKELPHGFRMILCTPEEGSACKRWHMFLRWMIRTGKPDLGIWNFSPALLCIPLDTHIQSLSQMIGFTTSASANNRSVTKITTALRTLDSDDPIRFDFALAHLGISGSCKKQWKPEICSICPLQSLCLHTKSIVKGE